jgi:hypothetical protein
VKYALRADRNQPEIAAALRSIGVTVQPLHTIGRGIPDLLCTFRGRTFLVEVKDPTKPKSDRQLTPAQRKWHAEWPGEIHVVETVEQAIAVAHQISTERRAALLA